MRRTNVPEELAVASVKGREQRVAVGGVEGKGRLRSGVAELHGARDLELGRGALFPEQRGSSLGLELVERLGGALERVRRQRQVELAHGAEPRVAQAEA